MKSNSHDIEYCLLNWWPTSSNEDIVHPNDIAVATMLQPYGKVFRNAGVVNGYSLIEYGEKTLLVKPESLRTIRADGLSLGDSVDVLERDGQNTRRHGKIVDMVYHHEKGRVMYFIHDGSRYISKRYFIEDLELVEQIAQE